MQQQEVACNNKVWGAIARAGGQPQVIARVRLGKTVVKSVRAPTRWNTDGLHDGLARSGAHVQ